jgi:hypothetical protein
MVQSIKRTGAIIMGYFTEQQLRELHKQCMLKLVSKARKLGKNHKDYNLTVSSIKNLFFDKIYWERGFIFNPTTNTYQWAWESI